MTHRPVENGVTFATSGTSAKSTAIQGKSTALRITSLGANTFVAIGTEPVATTANYAIPSNTSAVLASSNTSAKVVGVTTGTTTLIDFPQGTSSPYQPGDYVSLVVSSGATCGYYADTISHVPVSEVYNSANVGGYFSSRIKLQADTSGIKTAWSDNDGALRNSFKVAAKNDTGSGNVYIQQIQITGEA